MSNILQKTILGLDLGGKRVGLAISHGVIADSLGFLDFTNKDDFYHKILEIIAQQKVELCVVGLPLDREGRETSQSKWTRIQATQIGEKINIPIVFQEESYTSFEAKEELAKIKNKGDIDARSAVIILQRFIDEEPANS